MASPIADGQPAALSAMMEMVWFACGAALLALCVWLYVVRSPDYTRRSTSSVLTPDTTIRSAPLLSETDIVFYNLLRLAVQDYYLIFSQVPLWAFISVEATGKSRNHVLHHMALKRVDFAFVHPGSRRVEKVMHFEEVSPQPHQVERQRVIESVLDAAGIQLVKLDPQKAYTVPALAALLNLDQEMTEM